MSILIVMILCIGFGFVVDYFSSQAPIVSVSARGSFTPFLVPVGVAVFTGVAGLLVYAGVLIGALWAHSEKKRQNHGN